MPCPCPGGPTLQRRSRKALCLVQDQHAGLSERVHQRQVGLPRPARQTPAQLEGVREYPAQFVNRRVHTDVDPADPGRVRQLGQGVLQRDGLALTGVALQAHHRPHRGRVRDRPQHRPHGRRVHHLCARDQDRDLCQMLLLPQEDLPAGTLAGHDVQA